MNPLIQNILSGIGNINPFRGLQDWIAGKPDIVNIGPSSTPTPQPTQPTPQPANPGFKITVPVAQGNSQLPSQLSQLLGNTFDQSGQATNAAQVLTHPMEFTNIGNEQARGINTTLNTGENPQFHVNNIDIPNPDGSIDRGLFRINSNTFNEYLKKRPDELSASGISSWSDMNDQNKNAAMANIIRIHQGWKGWYAAPRNLRLGQ